MASVGSRKSKASVVRHASGQPNRAREEIEPVPGRSGTDAWAIQITREGIPTALLGIPLRNMHTSVETVSLKDVERTGRLMAGFIGKLEAGGWKLEVGD